MERPHYIIVGFENNNADEQTHDAVIFDMTYVTESYRTIGTEFYPQDSMVIIYGTKIHDKNFKEKLRYRKNFNRLPIKIKNI